MQAQLYERSRSPRRLTLRVLVSWDTYLSKMLEASGVGALVRRSAVLVWERAVSLAEEGCYPGGLKSNQEYLAGSVLADGVDAEDLLPLFDPQTSRGLLISVLADRAGDLASALEECGTSATMVGEIVQGTGVRSSRR